MKEEELWARLEEYNECVLGKNLERFEPCKGHGRGLGVAIWLSGSTFLLSLALFLLWIWRP